MKKRFSSGPIGAVQYVFLLLRGSCFGVDDGDLLTFRPAKSRCC